MKIVNLKYGIDWIGSLDPDLKVFDVIMETKFGTSYNSYVVKGDSKVAIFETVKEKYFDDYVAKLKESIGDLNKIDYLVINHTEPDHVGSVEKLLELLPNLQIVGSAAAIKFIKAITNKNINALVVKEGDEISLGSRTIRFLSVPFLHWPDSIYSYIVEEKLLITCDSFGAHYSFDDVLLSKLPEDKWDDYLEALDYYFTAIFTPFKSFLLAAIKKIENLPIDAIYTGHGPVIDKDPFKIVNYYKTWAQPTCCKQDKKVVIPYSSAYGYTEMVAKQIAEGLKSVNFEVKMYDVNIANFDELEATIVNDIQEADGVLFGSTTINGDALPLIWRLVNSLNPMANKGKFASAFGSFGWSGEAVPNIVERLNQMKLKAPNGFRVNFKPRDIDLDNAFEFGVNFGKSIIGNSLEFFK